jgi:ribosomal protein S18 acetylase RimI-like enzyme
MAASGKRYTRFYAPKNLMVLRGPRGEPKKGSRWILANNHGYAETVYLEDQKAINSNTFYIENLEIKTQQRKKGYGRTLFSKIEQFAKNIGAKWIQIDSESNAVGFWKKMGFTETEKEFYSNKVNMVKKI